MDFQRIDFEYSHEEVVPRHTGTNEVFLLCISQHGTGYESNTFWKRIHSQYPRSLIFRSNQNFAYNLLYRQTVSTAFFKFNLIFFCFPSCFGGSYRILYSKFPGWFPQIVTIFSFLVHRIVLEESVFSL